MKGDHEFGNKHLRPNKSLIERWNNESKVVKD
jgi:hypothetical protein